MPTHAKKTEISDDSAVLFMPEHEEILDKVETLSNILIHIRYEGKAKIGDNLKQGKEALSFFEKRMAAHIQVEDKIIFPYLEKHMPKLEPLIGFLRSEHEDFTRHLKICDEALEKAVHGNSELARSKILEQIYESGTYLAFLLKQHFRVGSENVYKVVDRELRSEEKKEILEKIRKEHRKARTEP